MCLLPARLRCRRTFKDPYGGGEIVDSASSSQRSGDDGRRRHKIVRECVVQIALWARKGHGQSQSHFVGSWVARGKNLPWPEAMAGDIVPAARKRPAPS